MTRDGIRASAVRRSALFLAAGLYAIGAPGARADAGVSSPLSGAVSARAALAADLADGRVDERTLIEAALIASGVHDPGTAVSYRDRIAALVDGAVGHAGSRGGEARRARRLFQQLHRTALLHYEASIDRFDALADHGLYNCVSAALIYLIAARQAGLDAAAVEAPLHVAVVVRAGGRDITVETTSKYGFDVKPLPMTRELPVERALAFLYHNAGLRELEAGDAEAAARDLAAAARIVPDIAYRSEELRATLARAIRDTYDSGRFRDAYLLAEATMDLLPERTTVTDRFVGVAARLVQETALAGRLVEAEDLADRALERLGDDTARRKLEAYVEPALARSAVMARGWDAARRHAARFRAVAADHTEADQLVRWVEHRSGSPGGKPAEDAARYAEEAARAAAHPPPGVDPDEYASVVQGVTALASLGRFEEALAVGRLQRESSGSASGCEGLDRLLRSVACGQVEALLQAERLAEAASALRLALADWPDDSALRALLARVDSAIEDPSSLAVDGPRAAAYAGSPAARPAPARSSEIP